ncbi:translation machinery-associated protein 16 [Leucoagaricus gongylophorus]
MAPSQSAKSAKAKKEKVFHPESRKAQQLARNALRRDKRSNQSSKRSQKHDSRADVYGFFFHALPKDGVLSLMELHGLIRGMLARNDQELEQERAARRRGRPKSVKETKLEDAKLVESELYRTGMEVLDLTHPVNVHLFRQWDQKEVSYVDHLRHIRVFSQQPKDVVVSRPGKHQLLIKDATDNPRHNILENFESHM